MGKTQMPSGAICGMHFRSRHTMKINSIRVLLGAAADINVPGSHHGKVLYTASEMVDWK